MGSTEEAITIRFDGRDLPARAGETIAAALFANGLNTTCRGKDGAPRGPFCGMGVCHDCLVTVDGRASQRACLVKAAAGMIVASQPAIPDVSTGTDLAAVPRAALPEEEVDILVIGAGPGGLSAAEVAARGGASVLVVDERPMPGGQYFKQPASSGSAPPEGPDAQARAGAALITAASEAGAELRGDTLLWGAFREDERLVIGYLREGRAGYVRPRILVIATGAFEQPRPFPGWTLPGVMTTGAAQTLVRSYGVAPGERILVAGNGPLNLQVAAELARGGAHVVAVAEAAPAPWTRPGEAMALMRAEPSLAVAGLRQLATLKRHGVPVLWRARLARVEGEGRARRAVLVGAKGEERPFAVDAVCIGERFAPANELPRLLGCAHTVSADGFPHLEVMRDDTGATSLADIFVVGEAGAFGGAHIAMAQGRLTGAESLRRLGRGTGDDQAARRRLGRHRRFQKALWRLFAAEEPGLADADNNTILCRCEAVTRAALQETAAEASAGDLATLKRLTRAGMGRCQGRYCTPRLAAFLMPPKEEAGFLAPQMPLRPVPLAALAVEKPEWGGHKRVLLPPSQPRTGLPPLDVTAADTVIVGAGIAGLSTALFLARAGREVVVLDRGRPNGQASGGNAGSLHAQLLSFDHGARAEGGGSPAARTLPLQLQSISLWQELARETTRDIEVKITGGLMMAETEEQLAFLVGKTLIERAQGVDCDVIDAATLRRLEPALDERFIGAAYCPQEGKINPLVATQAVLDLALAAGAKVVSDTEVTGIEADGSDYHVRTNRGTIHAGRIVNAAGAFAGEIGRMAGITVPVFGAPLQMIVTEAVAPLVSHLVAHADRHLTLKQAANGNVIIGGGWTAGLDPVHRRPRPLRASLEGNLWVAQHVVPALRRLNVIRSWAAMNINIDGAPILGEHPARPGFFNAVTSNGYTLGPMVGRITADLITRGRTDQDVAAFSIARFGT